MTQTPIKLSFEEYLAYDDGTDNRYELVDGELTELPPESPLNSTISRFLFAALLEILPVRRVLHKDTEIAVNSNFVDVRLPDLMVVSDELAAILRELRRGTITLDMPPPSLIVEVASPGDANRERDYIHKRFEYAARGVAEYWVVDPELNMVTVFTLANGSYIGVEYTGTMLIESHLGELHLTAEQVLNP